MKFSLHFKSFSQAERQRKRVGNIYTRIISVYCSTCVHAKSLQSCLCDPMDCSPPRSSVHEIFQARILEWVAISFSRGSSQPRDQTQVFCTAGRFFTNWATREATHLKASSNFLLQAEQTKRKNLPHIYQLLNSFRKTTIFCHWQERHTYWACPWRSKKITQAKCLENFVIIMFPALFQPR